MKIIDVHTHCFPDFLAEKAMKALTGSGDFNAHHNGTLNGLKSSMDKAGINRAVIQSIATKPDQAEKILNWSIEIKDDRFDPYISIHPETKDYNAIILKAKDNGIYGAKVHPHYQGFLADDEKIFHIYEAFCKHNLIVFFHAGEDLAYPGRDNASPQRMKKVIEKFPQMKIILAHMGAYRQWQEVNDLLSGTSAFFETSFILEEKGEEGFKKIFDKHGADRIMFGTDSPWLDQSNAVSLLNACSIDNNAKDKIFHKNYENLAKSVRK